MQLASDTLTLALVETLETMAFSTLMPRQAETLVPEAGALVEIRFQGSCQGVLQLWGGQALGRILAENIGCLEETDEQSALDAWQEICNVVCGLVLPQLAHDPADVFNITVPRVVNDASMPSWEAFTALPQTEIFDIDGHALAARLTVETGS